MNRIHYPKNSSTLSHQEFSRKIAIHEAGHVAAIYLGNQQKGLPPVFFQVVITSPKNQDKDQTIAKVEGGRLLHTLPVSFDEAVAELSVNQLHAYELAFEADIVNLLVGSLAEAKYIALRDDEPFNIDLLNLEALKHYGGLADLAEIQQYLNCYRNDNGEREKKTNTLFQAAFQFVNQRSKWHAIITLADFILATDKQVIQCNEISKLLENKPQNTRQHLPPKLARLNSYQTA